MWGIIINPTSGTKALKKHLRCLFKTLENRNISYEKKITQYANHAAEIARNFVENSFKKILVVGGDGTFSEVINGIFSAKNIDTKSITIALIPHGTGNDWGRFWELTRNSKKSTEIFLNGNTTAIDIGKLEFHRNGDLYNRFFVNSVGFGFDHRVVHETNKLKFYFGSHSILYFLGLLKAVFFFKSKKMLVKTQEMQYEGQIFSMNIGNGCYSGGGIKQNPTAIPTDGFFDAMLVLPLTFKDILQALPLLFNGKLTSHHCIKTIHSSEIEIITNTYLPFETDGIEEHAMSPYKIKLLPAAINMIVP
jgi:diacylglycerol kinase (ATP)